MQCFGISYWQTQLAVYLQFAVLSFRNIAISLFLCMLYVYYCIVYAVNGARMPTSLICFRLSLSPIVLSHCPIPLVQHSHTRKSAVLFMSFCLLKDKIDRIDKIDMKSADTFS
jgi:hypothetical protein